MNDLPPETKVYGATVKDTFEEACERLNRQASLVNARGRI